MTTFELPAEFVARMNELTAESNLKIPPPIFVEMGGEVVEFDMAQKLMSVRFPVQERYQNPMGYMQGGMIATAVDNVMGPLSFMVAPPSVTKTLEMTYLRPVTPSMTTITVVAWLAAEADHDLVFEAEVRRDAGTVLAKATARNRILRRWR